MNQDVLENIRVWGFACCVLLAGICFNTCPAHADDTNHNSFCYYGSLGWQLCTPATVPEGDSPHLECVNRIKAFEALEGRVAELENLLRSRDSVPPMPDWCAAWDCSAGVFWNGASCRCDGVLRYHGEDRNSLGIGMHPGTPRPPGEE